MVRFQAGVAVSAVVSVLFAEVAEQQAAAAQGVVVGIVQHGVDACFVAFLPFVVDVGREVELRGFDPGARVSDVWDFFAGDVADDVYLCEVQQQFVHAAPGESGACGQQVFADEGVSR